jgi:hypothetical protein
MSRTPPGGTIRDQIVQLAARPEGVNSRNLQDEMGMRDYCVPINMQALEYQGRVLRAKADGHRLQWFKHVEHRDAWLIARQAERMALLAAESARQQAERALRKGYADARRAASEAAKAAKPVKPAPAQKLAPVIQRSFTAGPSRIAPAIKDVPVDFSRAVYTIDDKVRPTARWQMQPSQPTPGFSTLGVGRYLA